VRAVFNSTGINFSDNYNSFFEAPKGSNNKTIGCNTLWIAGKDIHGSMFLSGGVNSSTGRDYYPGPLTNDGTASTDSSTMAHWNKVWKVSKEQIEYHKTHCANTGYIMPDEIAYWPANGDTSLHQDFQIAPFYDANGDGVYTPSHGDYPLIRGDEAIFFVFNDRGGLHEATGAVAGGFEIQAMAYAFKCADDSALRNTVFLHYKIINRRTFWYSSVVMGIYSDQNMGNPQNDFTRSDIQRNSFYTYTATNTDPIVGNYFGAQATTLLGGPSLNPDSEDNPAYDSLNLLTCNESINGLNFGDGIADNERLGLTGFISFNKGGLPISDEPTTCGDYLHYLETKWKDGSKLMYGGHGTDYIPPYGPDCHFMYPGLSDPCNWGSNGNPPNGPQNWTEETASNSPGDRHGLGITGPSTIDAGDYKEMDIAFIFGMDYLQPGQIDAWRDVLNQRIDSIRSYFRKDATPCGGSISGISQTIKDKGIQGIEVYPNPTSEELYVNFPIKISGSYTCQVYNMQGVLCLTKQLSALGNTPIDVSSLAGGMYELMVSNGNTTYRTKFVKH
jgi:hypothetical protein